MNVLFISCAMKVISFVRVALEEIAHLNLFWIWWLREIVAARLWDKGVTVGHHPAYMDG
jgi:hypothetical protein